MAEQGFGLMGFSAFYSTAKKTTDDNAVSVFKNAVESGVTLFNSATFYGPLNIGKQLNKLHTCKCTYLQLYAVSFMFLRYNYKDI